MKTMKSFRALLIGLICVTAFVSPALGGSAAFKENIYDPGSLEPVDSTLKVKVGEKAPGFTLPSVSGGEISLHDYVGKKNVVLSFVPAAWTPVCSDQWPGYNILKGMFEQYNAMLIGITVDNIPTLHAWTKQMVSEGDRLWFPVLADFWPHGGVSDSYGVLRSDGVSERAIFVIDKDGLIRHIQVYDINKRPSLETIVSGLKTLKKG